MTVWAAVLAATGEQVQWWGSLTGVAALFGVILKVLARPDTRWQGLVDAEQAARVSLAADLAKATAELAEVSRDRDYWRDRAIACENGNPPPDRRS